MDDFLAPERYETNDFIIRSYHAGDGPLVREAVVSSYDHLKTFIHWASPDQTELESEKIARRLRAHYLLGKDYTLGIWTPDEKEVLGGTGFHLRDGPPEWRNAEIGMWIRADRAHKGLGTAVLKALLEWGFSDWPFERLSWRCDPENLASIRVAEKAGLEREGVFRSQQLLKDGRRRDSVCYAALRPTD